MIIIIKRQHITFLSTAFVVAMGIKKCVVLEVMKCASAIYAISVCVGVRKNIVCVEVI
jgi:hypothetical protein